MNPPFTASHRTLRLSQPLCSPYDTGTKITQYLKLSTVLNSITKMFALGNVTRILTVHKQGNLEPAKTQDVIWTLTERLLRTL